MNNISTSVPIADSQPTTQNSQQPKRGAPPGNRNARKHGYYSKRAAGACRQTLNSAGYVGLDLEIVLAMWQAARLTNLTPGRDLLQDTALGHLFALVRSKYGIGRRDRETLLAAFLRLCFDLVLRPELQIRLHTAQEMR